MSALTVETIKKIIEEEKKKLKDEGLISSQAEEDGWAGGKNLVNKIDYIKKLGIKERKYRKKANVYKKLKEMLENK